MLKKLRTSVTRELEGALRGAGLPSGGLGGAPSSAQASGGEHPVGSGSARDEEEWSCTASGDLDGIFEIGEEDLLAPLFEPFAEDVDAPLTPEEPEDGSRTEVLPSPPQGGAGASSSTSAAAGHGDLSTLSQPALGSESRSSDAAGTPSVPSGIAEALTSYRPHLDRACAGEGPIVALLVVDFHDTHGPVVEWVYPPPTQSRTSLPPATSAAAEDAPICLSSGSGAPSGDAGVVSPEFPGALADLEAFPEVDAWAPAATRETVEALRRQLEQVMPLIAFLALPEAAHHAPLGATASVFFVLPCSGSLLYGVSCHRRVGTADLLHKDASVLRGTVQKAVCALSRCPFFGLVQQRLSPVTQVFFEQKDFRCTELLGDFHRQLDVVPFEKLPESELFHGLDHTELFSGLRHRLLSVLKAILLEGRIIVYSPSAGACSRTVLCLLSLLPGGLWLTFNSDGFGGRHFHFKRCGLPLRCFGPRCCLHPYLGIQQLDTLHQMKGFLVGTTNRMVVERASPDVVLDVPAATGGAAEAAPGCTVEFKNKELRTLSRCTPADRAWLQEAWARLKAAAPPVRPAPPHDASVERTQSPPPPSLTVVAAQDPLSAVADESTPLSGSIPANVQTFAMADDDDDDDDNDAETCDAECTKRSESTPSDDLERPSSGEKVASDPIDWLFGTGSAPQLLQPLRVPVPAAADPLAPLASWAGGLLARQRSALATYLADDNEGLLRETSWAAVLDSSRATFWAYWERLLSRTAYVAGPERHFSAGLELSSREARGELACFGFGFVQHWASKTDNGALWLQAHKLPVPERRPRPPRAGAGVYHFANGDEYHGQFYRGVRHGEGVYIGRKHRVHYDGEWRQDRRSGHGILTIENGKGNVLYTYDGEWLTDQRHGRGSCVRRCKEKYTGQWAANLYHGAGLLVDGNGALYDGEWAKGKFNGVGKRTHPDGDTYTGEFMDGERHGMGQLVRAASQRVQTPPASVGADAAEGGIPEDGVFGSEFGAECLFAGEWRAGRRNGHGKAIYMHGEYEGEWVDGMRHGQGVVSQHGYQLEGAWVAGMPDESGVHLLFYPCGAKYTGGVRCRARHGNLETSCWPGDSWWIVPEGQGLMKQPDGRLYEGEHRGGLPHGCGMALDADRKKYEGDFVAGKRHGVGFLTPCGGRAEQVCYEDGLLLDSGHSADSRPRGTVEGVVGTEATDAAPPPHKDEEGIAAAEEVEAIATDASGDLAASKPAVAPEDLVDDTASMGDATRGSGVAGEATAGEECF